MSDSNSASSCKVSTRAKRGTCFFLLQGGIVSLFLLFICTQASARRAPQRPRIIGIAGVTIFVSDIPAARGFYQKVINPGYACDFCEDVPSRSLFLPNGQRIELEQVSAPSPSSLLAEVSFRTDDLEKFRKFLKANKVVFKEMKNEGAVRGYGTLRLVVEDPEGHHISFVAGPGISEPSIKDIQKAQQNQNSGQSQTGYEMIHTGFVVHDRAAEDKFYKDILGFHVYWHGGMKDGEDNWVDMQVPDGSDWIEYMLGVSPDASHKTLGVMNHIALGVPDIHAAQQQLIKNGWKGTEEPKIGRDGKWQLNLYDPDETRVELMEFKPTKEPCCSAYTGPHPGPAQ
jgi:catechol 2,3-dioxygenase-like lactoylglutathione lyase family enzyme